LPFPGAPRYENQSLEEIVSHAVDEGVRYRQGGIDGLIIENGWDLPFSRPDDIGFETVAAMSVVANAVRETSHLPIGINLLANGALPGIAVAKAVQASFIRVNQWVNAYVSNEGFMQGESAKVLRYRSFLHAKNVKIFADVHVKHGAHAIVDDRPVEEQARDVEFYDADVAIATGQRTGDATPLSEIEVIKSGTQLPVIIGSGLNVTNARQLMQAADGAIVGSSLKKEGVWWNTVDVDRVKALVEEVDQLRN
jgi:membrane complex biogenesis BtpA family protein